MSGKVLVDPRPGARYGGACLRWIGHRASRGACGEAAYVPGMAGFVLVSRGTTALAPRLDPLKAILATLEPPLPPYQRPLPLRTLSLAS